MSIRCFDLSIVFVNSGSSMSILIVVLIKIFHFSIRFSRYNCQMTSFRYLASGDGEIRTLDPLLARQVLSQLSYTPMVS